MQQATLAPMIAMISPAFCTPNPLDLSIVRDSNFWTLKHGGFLVTDANNDTCFKVKGSSPLSLRDRRVLLDVVDCPIVTFRRKLVTLHERWKVFRGAENTDSSNLVFSVKTSSCIQFKTELDVYLAINTEEKAPDFRVEVSWLQGTFKVYVGNSIDVIAKIKKKKAVARKLLLRDNFNVTVNPGVDYAFIVALIVILDEILETKKATFRRFLSSGLNGLGSS